ncbi:hypothetical protein [Xanthomonas arboricola]|uniref:hypothetical protein n=1 Tax=Xanthomonas arboricola TaxID=56448 RepID=UPI001379A2E9|nr:hypothetical protein [Xanthomonas arboricola]
MRRTGQSGPAAASGTVGTVGTVGNWSNNASNFMIASWMKVSQPNRAGLHGVAQTGWMTMTRHGGY